MRRKRSKRFRPFDVKTNRNRSPPNRRKPRAEPGKDTNSRQSLHKIVPPSITRLHQYTHNRPTETPAIRSCGSTPAAPPVRSATTTVASSRSKPTRGRGIQPPHKRAAPSPASGDDRRRYETTQFHAGSQRPRSVDARPPNRALRSRWSSSPSSHGRMASALASPCPNGPSSNGHRLTVPGSQGPRDRKLSLPLQLQRRPSLSGYAAAVESAKEDARRRKFSQVGQAMSHRLSTTIGLKLYTVTTQEVAEQAKSLCGRYLRAKLRTCGAVHKKLGLQRLKSVSNLSIGYPTADVAQRLRLVCTELERNHPDLYQTVTGNIGLHALPSETAVQNVFEAVARELFRNDISWGRIVALYSVSGGLAVDCVKLGHPEYVLALVQALGLFVERDLASWISQQGGWSTLVTRFRKQPKRSIIIDFIFLLGGLLALVLLVYYWLS